MQPISATLHVHKSVLIAVNAEYASLTRVPLTHQNDC